MALTTVSSDRLSTNVKNTNFTAAEKQDLTNDILPLATQFGQSKNLIINGAMQVAQRGTSSTTSGYGTVDRFKTTYSGTDEAPTFAQVDVASGTTPYTSGFRKALKVTNGNQTSGAGAADLIEIMTKLEAQDVANSGWNYLSTSSFITLSFWVKSSVAQNFYGWLYSMDGTARNYSFETGSLTADTWTKVTKVVPGSSSPALQFDDNNGEGLQFAIWPFFGTNYTASGVALNSWMTTNNAERVPDYTSTWYTTNDATFEITGVQLEVGSVATDFEHRSFGDELRRCQRYFNMIADGTNYASPQAISNAFWWSANELDFMFTFPVEMRATPSIYQVTGSNYFNVRGGGVNVNNDGNFTLQYTSKRSTNIYCGPDSGGTQGNAAHIFVNNTAARLGFNAEL